MIFLDHFGFFFGGRVHFSQYNRKKTEKIDKSSKPSAARCDWMKAVGRDLNPPITERLNKSEIYFFLKKNLMRNKALLDHPESNLHNRKSKVFFFSFKINIKKGQNLKQIYFLCQPNSIPRRFILFYF